MPTGISNAKWNRLIMHLEKVEEETGAKLRKTPRYGAIDCPIENFAPGRMKSREFSRVTTEGTIIYISPYTYASTSRVIYEREDSTWWSSLPDTTRAKVTKEVMLWIKARAKGGD